MKFFFIVITFIDISFRTIVKVQYVRAVLLKCTYCTGGGVAFVLFMSRAPGVDMEYHFT